MAGYKESIRNARLNLISAAMDAGAGGANVFICDGTKPATGGAVTNVLATVIMNITSFPAAASGTMSANTTTPDASAAIAGLATWFRVEDSVGVFVTDGTVGLAASGKEMILTDTTIAVGSPVDITDYTINEGNA